MCVVPRREGGPACPQPDCHISQHYKLLLQLFLQCHKAPGIMFLEEDLEVAPDFFSYFENTAPLMAKDSSIYCVSAWADHGQRGRANDSRALYRTDVMPGLGWYLNAAIGLELAPKWPMTNWDDWMRLSGIKNGRSCIYPEVCVGIHVRRAHVLYCLDLYHLSFTIVTRTAEATIRSSSLWPPLCFHGFAVMRHAIAPIGQPTHAHAAVFADGEVTGSN